MNIQPLDPFSCHERGLETSYQAEIDRDDRAEERVEIYAAQIIDEHERLKDSSAFEADFDLNKDVLVQVWRILKSRPVTEGDEALADIRTEVLRIVNSYANTTARATVEREQSRP